MAIRNDYRARWWVMCVPKQTCKLNTELLLMIVTVDAAKHEALPTGAVGTVVQIESDLPACQRGDAYPSLTL